MHYQRMHPQPPPMTDVACRLPPPPHDWWGLISAWTAHEVVAPVDMPGAEPWRDRDGTWYWRRAPQ